MKTAEVIAAFSQHSSEAMKTQSLFCWTLLLSAISANEIQYDTKYDQELASQHPTCVDNHKYCPYWASKGECFSNPVSMLTDCKKSCNQCVTPNALLTMARKIVALELSRIEELKRIATIERELQELKRRTTTTTTTKRTTTIGIDLWIFQYLYWV